MKVSYCELCGNEAHTLKRVLRYTEKLSRVNRSISEYDVCIECSERIDKAKIEAEFNEIKLIRDQYLSKDEFNKVVEKSVSEVSLQDKVLVVEDDQNSESSTSDNKDDIN